MSVVVKTVDDLSPCAGKLKPGDRLLSVNSNEVNDVLDYRFYTSEEKLKLRIERGGKEKTVKIKKGEYDDLGLGFETYLMDKQHSCKNKCVFCFIDQMPPGMRDTLYFKDDDSRLSFLFGNYVTLTNLSDADVERLITMKISPVNVSVHTMNPELRVRMMKNPRAGECLKYLRRFADAGIKLNTQLVLCPGINDGKELEYSLAELGKLYPAVQSIAAVPVGLTRYREGLPKLEAFSPQSSRAVIDVIDDFNAHFLYFHGETIAYAADEFYINAGLDIPGEDYYGSYPQLENGVGMCRLLETEFMRALESNDSLPSPGRRVTIVTGTAAAPLIRRLAEAAEEKLPGLKINVAEVVNRFFGESVTVSGLLTGGDMLRALSGQDLGDEILIPANSLKRDEDVFLDDMTPSELERELGVKVTASPTDGFGLLEAIIGENNDV